MLRPTGFRLAIAPVLLICLLTLAFFGPALLTDQTIAFRDGVSFYRPLLEWISGEWADGRIPLWNPTEATGMPLLADATSAVLYPGQIILVVPWSDFATRYETYIAAHLMLAAFGAFMLARHFRASSPAATICAVSYAFGGNVLFQYCNIVFLVGAAWLPFALLAGDKMLSQRSFRWGAALAVVLALMVLGGDPQAAYHAGLLLTLSAFLAWRRTSRHRSSSTDSIRTSRFDGIIRGRFAMLAFAAGLAGVLSAVQVLPSLEWSRRSTRSQYEAPRSMYEAATCATNAAITGDASRLGDIPQGIIGQPPANSHRGTMYKFSVGPWRLPELIWPNFSGRTFPENRRWIQSLPVEGRTWTPSLYMGILPLLLALSALRLRTGPRSRRWVSWWVVLSALGAMGMYGLGWFLHRTYLAMPGSSAGAFPIGQPVGGVYWFMVVLLPGYAQFRYPAKLLVVCALGMSLLAARGWDRRIGRADPHVVAWLKRVGIASCLAAIAALLLKLTVWHDWFANSRPSVLLGPLDAQGAANDILIGMLHTAFVCGLLWGLLRTCPRVSDPRRAIIAAAVTVIVCADLFIANRWMIGLGSEAMWHRPPLAADAIAFDHKELGTDSDNSESDGSDMRVYRGSADHWVVPAWRATSDVDRLTEWSGWLYDTLAPRYHLASKVNMLNWGGSMQSSEMNALFEVACGCGQKRPDGAREPPLEFLSMFSVNHLILPPKFEYASMPDGKELEEVGTKLEHARVWRNPDAFPRAWVVRDVKRVAPIKCINS